MTVLQKLYSALGQDAIITDPVQLDAVRTDRSGWISEGMPLAIVEANTVEEVQKVARIAYETETPLVPRGAGTGLAGGANGINGSIVVSLERMNRILEIVAQDEYAVVEPGVINSELNRELKELGLWFAPDPVSKDIATIGGNVATNAGGMLCTKYGVTREAILALDIVLADGTLLRTGRRTIKGVTGYDLTSLFVGSEGTLGIIVGVTVRLLPIPVGATSTVGAYFANIDSAAQTASAITAAGLRPAVMELIDGETLDLIREYLGQDVCAPILGGTNGGSFMLIQFDANTGRELDQKAFEIIEFNGGKARLAPTQEEADRLLEIRRSANPAISSSGTMLVEDVAVPRSRMAEMFREISCIARKHHVRIPTIAHAGDGNLHPTFIFEGAVVPAEVWNAANEIFQAATLLGGTLTGEHGVGLLKKRWLKDEIGIDSYSIQCGIKKVFDPLNIMNPGKVIDL